MRQGRLVLLNGPSSAGKTSVVQALSASLPTPWLVMPVDLFHSIRSRPPQASLSDDEWAATFRRTRAAYHRALAGAALAGCDVIGDYVLSEHWRLTELLEVTDGVDVLLVHVTCDVDELERRERQRGDRDLGTARRQLADVFVHGAHDLEVDTTNTSPEDCAARIAQLLTAPPSETAFERLRHRER